MPSHTSLYALILIGVISQSLQHKRRGLPDPHTQTGTHTDTQPATEAQPLSQTVEILVQRHLHSEITACISEALIVEAPLDLVIIKAAKHLITGSKQSSIKAKEKM